MSFHDCQGPLFFSPPTSLHLLPRVTLSGTKKKSSPNSFRHIQTQNTVIFYKNHNRIKFVQAQKTQMWLYCVTFYHHRGKKTSHFPLFIYLFFCYFGLAPSPSVSLFLSCISEVIINLTDSIITFPLSALIFSPPRRLIPPNPCLLFSSFIPLPSLSSPSYSLTHPASFITSQCGLSDLNILHFFYVFSSSSVLNVFSWSEARTAGGSVQHLDSSAMKPCCF